MRNQVLHAKGCRAAVPVNVLKESSVAVDSHGQSTVEVGGGHRSSRRPVPLARVTAAGYISGILAWLGHR